MGGTYVREYPITPIMEDQMIKQMDVTPEVASALANLRLIAQAAGTSIRLRNAINTLDDAGVFAEIDERYGYASPADVLHEIAQETIPNTLDPAEWGDTTSADIALRSGLFDASGKATVMLVAKHRTDLIAEALERDEREQPVSDPSELICRCGAPTDAECIC